VVIPTRIRTPSRDLVRRDADLSRALAAALGRALGDVERQVVRPRAPYGRATMFSPTFVWAGHGAGEIGIDQRAAFETRVSAVIADAFAALGGGAGDALPAVLRAAASERIDPDRYDRTLGLYKIPSFDDGGAPTAIDVERAAAFDEPGGVGSAFRVLASIDDVRQALSERVDVASLVGPVGVLFEVPGAEQRFGLIVARFPEGRIIITTIFSPPTEPAEDATGRLAEMPITLSPVGHYSLTWVGGRTQVRQIYRSFYAERLRAFFLDRARSTGHEEMSVAEKIPALIEEWIDGRIGSATAAAGVLVLQGDSSTLLSLSGDSIVNLSAAQRLQGVVVIPLTESVAGEAGRGRGAAAAAEGQAPEDDAAAAHEEAQDIGSDECGPPAHTVGGLVPRRPEIPVDAPLALFPPAARGPIPQVADDEEGFEGEPSVDALGEFGQALINVMEEIASRLRMPRGRFAGKFVIDAAAAVRHLALETAAWPPTERATTAAAQKRGGNVGPLDVSPAASPQIDFLRHLAGTLPLIRYLRDLVDAGYQSRPHLISGRRHCDAPGWLLDFVERHVPMLAWAAGDVFAAACQVLFLQLLNSSADAIQARLGTIDVYAAHFEQAILPELRHLDELLRMQVLHENARLIEQLALYNPQELRQRFPDARLANASPVVKPQPSSGSWTDAAASFTEALQSVPPPAAPRAAAYEIVPLADRSYRVLDKDGRLWSEEELERGILLRRGVLESADPLITQMVDLPDVMQRFNRAPVKEVIRAILTEMAEANRAVAARSRRDVHAGFQASRISTPAGPLWKQYATATVHGTPYRLGGIHALAHEAIGDAFGGDPAYGEGINYLFGSERGKEELLGLLEFTGIVILAIFCPPLAEALGYLLAGLQLERAEERAQTYRALIEPETVLSRAEVEAELFAAELGAVLAFLPAGLKILSEARAAFSLEQQAAREIGEAAASGTKTAGEAAQALSHLTSVIEEGFATVFIKESAKAWLINEAIGAAIRPLVERVAERVERTGPTGGLQGAMGKLVSLQRQRRKQRRSP
jgi:hypothetical protein